MKTKYFSVLFVFIIALMFTGCMSTDKAVLYDVGDIQENSSIVVYNFAREDLPNEVIEGFRDSYSYCDVDVKNVDSSMAKIKMHEINNNLESADVIIFDLNSPFDPNLLAVDSYFEDLTDLFDNDETFNLENYYLSTTNAGMFNGKKYIVPLKFYMPNILINNEKLEEYDLNFDIDSITYSEFIELISGNIEMLLPITDKTGLLEHNEVYERLGTYVRAAGVDLYDYEKDEYIVNQDQFRDVMELGNSVYSRVFSSERSEYIDSYDGDIKEMISNATFTYSPCNFTDLINFVNNYSFSNFDIYTLPDYNNPESYNISAALSATVNVNSQNKQDAFNFIRTMMDMSYIEDEETLTYSSNKNINEDYINSNLNEGQAVYKEKIIKILDSANKCYIPSLNMDKLLIRTMKQYFKGEMPYEEAYEEMELYMNDYSAWVSDLPKINGIVEDERSYLFNTDVYPAYLYGNDKNNVTFAFRMSLPENYDENEKYPLYVYFHGSGEEGTDNNVQAREGSTILPDKIIDSEHESIIIIPQMPYWIDEETENFSYTDQVHSLIEELIKEYSIDESRIYLSGFSRGGYSVCRQLENYPDYYAGCLMAAPSLYNYFLENDEFITSIKDTPIYLAHGEEDEILDISRSIDFVEKIEEKDGNIRFKKYPELNHSELRYAFYNEDETLEWLFSQSRDVIQ